jgi:hypothetical protein
MPTRAKLALNHYKRQPPDIMDKANSSDMLQQALLDQIQRFTPSGQQHQCLLWIDPAQADPLDGNSLVEQRRVRVPIQHPRFEPSRAPYLVPLDLSHSDDADLFRDSVDLAWLAWSTEYLQATRGQAISGWVTTNSSAKALAAHWARKCHLHIRQRQTKLLRFQDPGVREWLWRTLNRTQQQAMLGPATALYAIGRGQRLISHHCVTGTSSLNEHPVLQLNQAQWDEVEDYATVHSAWLKWCGRAPGETQLLGHEWERPILGALSQATYLGIRDTPDRELFALHALQLGASFHQLPELQEVWRKTRTGDFYGNAIEERTGKSIDTLASWVKTQRHQCSEGKHG